MAAPEKYPDEIGECATRTPVETRRDSATMAGALVRVAQRLGSDPQTPRNRFEQAEKARSYRYGHPRTVL